VRGLGTKDVQLFENGVKQEVSYFREASSLGDPSERVPLSIILVLDTSGSMKPNMHFLQEAVLNFLYKLDEIDTALLVSFNESVKGSAEFTGDTDRLERFVEGLQAWGGTSLYDAIHYSLGRIKDAPGRKALVIFSDGADTTSQLQDKDVVDYARAVEATVYSIGFKGEGGMMSSSPRGFLRKIATETGGQYFAPGQGRRADQGLQRDLERAQEPLPARLHADEGARRHLARDRAQGQPPRHRGARAQGLLLGEAPPPGRLTRRRGQVLN
jgi:VWFA-related protein